MSFCCRLISLLLFLKVVVFVLLCLTGLGVFNSFILPSPSSISRESRYWGPGEKTQDKTDVKPFSISVPDADWNALIHRVKTFKFVTPLEDSQFNYGFNGDFMKTLVKHWTEKYDFKKWLAVLNSFKHFKTQIDGLDVHYIHAKPTGPATTIIPMIIIHGWPGSVFEFYKLIPLLTKPVDGVAFELIVPSIPGYGWSEAPHKMGFNSIECAKIFLKLMKRLGFEKNGYYIQGGDWGSMIGTAMTRIAEPKVIRGFHSNLLSPGVFDPRYMFELMVFSLCPSLIFDQKNADKVYPYLEKMGGIMRESGYFHLQATRPDTVGHALSDSPVGLAAYILEKYSVFTNQNYRGDFSGALVGKNSKFTLDELITATLVYWFPNAITSSIRFYKENMGSNDLMSVMSMPSDVPFGAASLKYDLATTPERWMRYVYPNLLQYNDFDGGHFAAFELPEAMATDIRSFVPKAEAFWKQQKANSKSEL